MSHDYLVRTFHSNASLCKLPLVVMVLTPFRNPSAVHVLPGLTDLLHGRVMAQLL